MKRQGFTLIELLVVMSVLSVVSTIGVTMFVRLTDYWRLTSGRLDMRVLADQALEEIQEDINHLCSARLSGVPLHGQERLSDRLTQYNLARVEDDFLVLPIEYINPLQNQRVRGSVMYHIDRSNLVPALVRTHGAFGSDLPEGASEVLAEGVMSLRVEYFDGAEWSLSWGAENHPQAVAVNFVMHDINRPMEQVAARRVYQVNVQ